MTAIGIPLGQDCWWEHCTWPDGSPAHLMTLKEYGDLWAEEYKTEIEELAQIFIKQMTETLNQVLEECKK